jgi:hypothetical protein
MIEDKSGIFLAGAHKKARTPIIAREGILDKITVGKKAVSRTRIQVLDLVAEGVLEGLVSGKFLYSGQTGDIGYVSGKFEPYEAYEASSSDPDAEANMSWKDNIRWLRSIYWDDVPLVDSSEKLNFANIDVSYVKGIADGVQAASSSSFSKDISRSATKTRTISQRLRGPNYNFAELGRGHARPTEKFDSLYDPDAAEGTDAYNDHRRMIVNQRKYRVLNRSCIAVVVNIKIVNLEYRELQNPKKMGDARNTTVNYLVNVDPVFSPDSPVPETVQEGFKQTRTVTAKGRITMGFINSTRIDLPNMSQRRDFIGWEVTVIRKTFDTLDSRYQNTTVVDSLTEIYESSYSYPNSAIVSSKFSAEYFAQVPTRKFDMRLTKVKVPSNYNPWLRNYGQISGGARYQGRTGLSTNHDGNYNPVYNFVRSGDHSVHSGTAIGTWEPQSQEDYSQSISQTVINISGLSQDELGDHTVNGTTDIWDGTFKDDKQWTDNPAWVFYDLLTNKRYGLGNHISEDDIDKWTLYKIGQYCDRLVPDGEGGLEPRFSANILLNKKEEAFKVVNHMASIFRGIAYYGQGSIFAVQDAEKDPVMLFNNSNVLNSDFVYQSSNKKARHNIAIVKYLDKENFHKPAVEYVKDVESIKKYGEREVETTAYGASKKSQAIRWGRWTLLTENLQTETVSFIVGLEASYLRPGDVFRVHDQNRTDYQFGGRLSGIRINDNKGAVVTLDRYISFKGLKDADGSDNMGTGVLSIMAPTYHYDPVTTTLTGSTDTEDIRRSHLLEYTFWTGHSARTDADGYISEIQGPSGSISNGIVQITLTGTQYETHNIDTGVFDFDLTSSEVSNMPLAYTIHDQERKNPESQLYSTLSVKENEMGKIAVMGLEYNTGKYDLIEQDFRLESIESPYISKKPPLKPSNVSVVNDGGGNMVYRCSVAQKKTDTGKDEPDPDHNTSIIFVYHKFEPDANASAEIVGLHTNYFQRATNSTLAGKKPGDRDATYKDHLAKAFAVQGFKNIMEDSTKTSNAAGYYNFAFFSMNYHGEFSAGVFETTFVTKAETVSKLVGAVEIAGLELDTGDRETTVGSSDSVVSTDVVSLGFSWVLGVLDSDVDFLYTYGVYSMTGVNRRDSLIQIPLDTSRELFFLITLRAVSLTATPNTSIIYNFNSFPTLDLEKQATDKDYFIYSHLAGDDNVNKLRVTDTKFLLKAFYTSGSKGTRAYRSVSVSPMEMDITIKDIVNLNQLNWYEDGPPREYDVVVELINKEKTLKDGDDLRHITSAASTGLNNYTITDQGPSDVGTNLGFDKLTVKNPRSPAFFLTKTTKEAQDEINQNDILFYTSTDDFYSETDLNSTNAYVRYESGGIKKLYLLIQNYDGEKTPGSTAAKGYWIELDSLCVAAISRQLEKYLILQPQKIFYYSQDSRNQFTEDFESSFGTSKFDQLVNGGFMFFSSNVASVKNSDGTNTSVFDRGVIHGLTQNIEQLTRNVKHTTLVEEQTVEVETNQQIFFEQQPFPIDDSQDSGGDSLIDAQRIRLEIPQNALDNSHKFFTIGSYDIFDGSVINEYEGASLFKGLQYKRKTIPLSNVIELGAG